MEHTFDELGFQIRMARWAVLFHFADMIDLFDQAVAVEHNAVLVTVGMCHDIGWDTELETSFGVVSCRELLSSLCSDIIKGD